jgi:hypothetical protein
MRFQVVGADKESGDDVDVILVAKNREGAEADACKRGILVSAITELPEEKVAKVDKDAIELVTDADAGTDDAVWAIGASGVHTAKVAKERSSHGTITLSANSPSETGYSGEAGARHGKEEVVGMEYHVVMNQALYLLETAVNKYLKDGWEPAGGLTVGISNNALQYFQALVRKRQPGAELTKHG